MFKKDFIWGVATSAVQIEGATNEDGKGQSIWDYIPSHKHEYMLSSDNAQVACDHYHLYKQDVQLIKQLGAKAYRLSISWARIIPDGFGKVNESGIAFYRNLIDELLNNGITPYVTLYHWDLPLALYDNGNCWLNRNIADAFAYYTKVVADNFSDKVQYFITLNEPQCIIDACGGVDPERQYSVHERLTIVHNILLAHGKMVQVLRNYPNVKVGYAPCSSVYVPVTESAQDIDAAKQAYFDIHYNDIWNVSLWSDPVILGHYPSKYYEIYSKDELPDIQQGDMQLISQPLDFYCQNIYLSCAMAQSDGKGGYTVVDYPKDYPMTKMDWPITPKALYYGPLFLYEKYKLPIIISENGFAFDDKVENDTVIDTQRINCIRDYVQQLGKAIDNGADVRGYFYWSLMDNFEWRYGYTKRFGLTYVDYSTQKRLPKNSYFFYKNVIEKNGNNL